MSYLSLNRHDQILTNSNDVQGWHPGAFWRWIFFLLPLAYFLVTLYLVLRRFISTRQKSWVHTQGADSHVQLLGGLVALFYFLIGFYSVIADAWSTREWVIWTYALVFGAFSILAYSLHDDCGVHVGLAISAFLGFFWFFFNQWLYAQTTDMWDGFWKFLVRNLIGFIVAVTFFYFLNMVGRVLVYIFGWTQEL